MKQNGGRTTYSAAKTVLKTLRILEMVGERQPVRAIELGKALGLARASAHRLLATLEMAGYVERNENAAYMLTYKVFRLGSTVPASRTLSEVARPLIARLSELTQENVNLGVRTEGQLIYLEKAESKHYLKLDQEVGKTDPLHCTGLGKVLLSGLPDDELEKLVGELELSRRASRTITDRSALLAEIRRVRQQGYAEDLQELSDDIHCLAAPVYNHLGEMVAAVSISGPVSRMPRSRMDGFRPLLLETVAEISRRMGYTERPAVAGQPAVVGQPAVAGPDNSGGTR